MVIPPPNVEDVRRSAPSTDAAPAAPAAAMISAEAKRVLLGRLGTEIASKILRVGGSSSRPRGRRRRRRRPPPPDDDDARMIEGISTKGRKKRTREDGGRRSAAAAVVATEGGMAAARCEVESVVRSRFVVGEFQRMAKMTGGATVFRGGGGGEV